jgi:hypothetical protein
MFSGCKKPPKTLALPLVGTKNKKNEKKENNNYGTTTIAE